MNQKQTMKEFSKELYDYVFRVHSEEQSRIKIIEDKGKFIFTINSLLITSFLFKYKDISEYLSKFDGCQKTALLWVFCLTVLFIGLCFLFIILGLKTRSYKSIMPDNFYDSIFNPGSGFFPTEQKDSFYEALSQHIVWAVEHNTIVIDRKNTCISFAFISIALAFAGVLAFVVMIFFYS